MTGIQDWLERVRFFHMVDDYTAEPYAAHVLQWAAQGWLYECTVLYLRYPDTRRLPSTMQRMQRIAAGTPR